MADRKPEIEEGSGNVFADLGLPDSEDLLLKSQIVAELHRLVRERGLTQVEAAKLMGIAQPDLSKLLRGELRGYSVERLARMLTAFDRDVEIVVKPRAVKDKRGRGRVTFTPGAMQPTDADTSRLTKGSSVRRKPLSSSNMTSAGYDAAAKVLEIGFPDGDVYRYFEVPPEIWRAFEAASSRGMFFAGEIRDRFAFERVQKSRRGAKDHTPIQAHLLFVELGPRRRQA